MNAFRYILLLNLHLLLSTFCFAQREQIDSLKKVLPSLKDSARIDCLNALSEKYTYTQIDTSQLFAQQALKEAEKLNYIAGEGEAYYNLAQVYSELASDYPKMEENAYKAVTLLNKVNNKKQQAKAYDLLGEAYLEQSKFSLSIEAYKKALELFKVLQDYSGILHIYFGMGGVEEESGHYGKSMQYRVAALEMAKYDNYETGLMGLASLYRDVGDYATALEYYRHLFSEAKTNKNRWPFAFICAQMGRTFFLQKAYDSAKLYYNLSIEYTGRKNGIAFNTGALKRRGHFYRPYARLGEVYLALHKYDTALIYLNNALDHFTKANDRNQVMRVLLQLSKAYKEKKDYKRALLNAQQLLQIANETGARQHIRDAHLQLYQLFKDLRKEDSGFRHLQLYTILRDSIDVDLTAQKLAFYKIQSEREKAQFSINLLNKEKQLQKEQLQQSTQQKKFLSGGIAALLIIGFFLFRNNMLKRRNEKQRLEHELELQRLESEKTKREFQHQATELEMQALRAQMSPHFIFNSLNSINRFILQNNKTEATDYLTKFSRLIRIILNSSVSTTVSLTEDLETLHLYLELESLRFNNEFSYKITCDPEVDADFIRVPPMLLQPFVENAIWHGLMNKEGRGHLWINLNQKGNTLICTIADDGIGRKKAAELKGKRGKHKSMGMNITESRIDLMNKINGENKALEIRDLVDADGNSAGTKVVIKIPVNYE